MAKDIAKRDGRNGDESFIVPGTTGETSVLPRDGEPVAGPQLRAAPRTFVTREDVAQLATGGASIDRHRFQADLDKAIEQGLLRDVWESECSVYDSGQN